MASSDATPRIVELAAQISTCVAQLQERLSAQGAPTPSFAEDSPENLPADVADLKDSVLDATSEPHELLLDPLALLFKFASVRIPRSPVNLPIPKSTKTSRSPISSASTPYAATEFPT